MTVKEALRELVDDMSEDEAAHVFDLIRSEREDHWPISDEERAAVEKGLADSRAGRFADLEDVELELGLR